MEDIENVEELKTSEIITDENKEELTEIYGEIPESLEETIFDYGEKESEVNEIS